LALAVTAVLVGWVASAAVTARAAGDAKLDELLWDLHIIPLEPAAPPAFAGRDLDGASVTLAQFRGRPVVLYFWATW
jgi:cytochrome oxidase Cu insertion factor (SCO1/SenC/PrrC family)